MSATLVIMAAGLASRYGSAKQIEKVGPAGEILMEYTLYDAKKAGFDRFVIILPPGIKEEFRDLCGNRLEKELNVTYAVQDFGSLPEWFAVPEGRVKPYGTVACVLAARDSIRGEFAVLNADDYYGPGAFALMLAELGKLTDKTACMVAYRLKNTVSDFGTVTRGVCTLENGRMTGVTETSGIGRAEDGSIRSFDGSGEGRLLDRESAVSMNFWGFPAAALEDMERYQEAFLRALAPGDLKSECLLPVMVGEKIREGSLTVNAVTTDDEWFGMTYKEDRATTAAMLRKLTEEGQYPAVLFP